MTVKEELGNLLERLVNYYEINAEGLPSIPKRKDVEQSIYIVK